MSQERRIAFAYWCGESEIEILTSVFILSLRPARPSIHHDNTPVLGLFKIVWTRPPSMWEVEQMGKSSDELFARLFMRAPQRVFCFSEMSTKIPNKLQRPLCFLNAIKETVWNIPVSIFKSDKTLGSTPKKKAKPTTLYSTNKTNGERNYVRFAKRTRCHLYLTNTHKSITPGSSARQDVSQ